MAATAVSSVQCCYWCSSSQTLGSDEFSGARSEANCLALCPSGRQRSWHGMVVRRGYGGAVFTNTFTSRRMAGKAVGAGSVVAMAPDDEKMTRRSPLDFPVEWERPSPGRRPDIFPQFSPMKTPLPPPLPADPPEEDEDEEEKKEEDPEKEDKPDE